MDIISTLPPGIIESILCYLPIQEAARTCILSKEWEYHWTKIPKLAFIEDMFQVADHDEYRGALNQRNTIFKRRKFFNAILLALLMHEGPIHEFVLSVNANDACPEIDQIVCHLSRKYAVKKLTLELSYYCPLPKNFFSMRQLTDLRLIECYLYTPSTLDGFGSVTSLSVQQGITASSSTLLKLLAYYPQLKNVDIRGLRTVAFDDTIINLFDCFPLIENLSICLRILKGFARNGVPQELPLTLVHLKFLYIENASLVPKDGLPILALLIKSSPSLEKLKLKICDSYDGKSEGSNSFTLEDCLDIGLEHLKELEIIDMSSKKAELDFVKLILAKSPVLKKVRIFLKKKFTNDEVLKVSRILLCYQRASPSVEIIIGSSGN